jgi:hypothetical protein
VRSAFLSPLRIAFLWVLDVASLCGGSSGSSPRKTRGVPLSKHGKLPGDITTWQVFYSFSAEKARHFEDSFLKDRKIEASCQPGRTQTNLSSDLQLRSFRLESLEARGCVLVSIEPYSGTAACSLWRVPALYLFCKPTRPACQKQKGLCNSEQGGLVCDNTVGRSAHRRGDRHLTTHALHSSLASPLLSNFTPSRLLESEHVQLIDSLLKVL